MSDTLDPESKEAWDYLIEVVGDYQRCVAAIGRLGLAAPNLLYYRDEIQEGLNEFKIDRRVDFRSVWERVKQLDQVLENKANDLVSEIGHFNFRQYRIINDPPKAYWWWYLDRVTPAPPPKPAWWKFWHYLKGAPPPEEEEIEPEPEPVEELPPAEFEALGVEEKPDGGPAAPRLPAAKPWTPTRLPDQK